MAEPYMTKAELRAKIARLEREKADLYQQLKKLQNQLEGERESVRLQNDCGLKAW